MEGADDGGGRAAAAERPAAVMPGRRRRMLLLLAVALLSLLAAGAYAATAFQDARNGQAAIPDVRTAPAAALPAESFVLFRNTAAGQGYGQVAFTPLAAPAGTRFLTGLSCDRAYASRAFISCLATKNGIPTRFEAATFSPALQPLQSWTLGGIPSRTRISPDGSLVASTVFVSGHSYASAGFSTETVIRGADGTVHGNLESFDLVLDGARIKAADRNIWGVTFVPGDGNAFYATASSQGNIWLVRGDLAARTLTVAATGVECPSISPDGRRIAFKKSASGSLVGERHPALLDLATGTITVLDGQRNIDDQIEWLDDNTILYGLPRDETGQDSDIWSLSTLPGARPELFIEHAWSPAVVR